MKTLFIFFFTLTIQFSFAQDGENPLPYVEKKSVYDVAPSFVGGEKALQKYFQDSIRYPEPEKTKRLQGSVSLKFVVNKNGTIKNIQALNGVPGAPNFVKEAIRAIKSMPKWNPATKKGKAVESEYHLHVPFNLK